MAQTHSCTLLGQVRRHWVEAGLPMVGYFHDREPALESVGWLSKWLDRWQEAVAKRLMDLRELAAAVGRRLYFDECDGGLHLTVMDAGAPTLVRPLPVTIRVPGGRLPPQVLVSLGDRHLSIEVYPLDHGLGRVIFDPVKGVCRLLFFYRSVAWKGLTYPKA